MEEIEKLKLEIQALGAENVAITCILQFFFKHLADALPILKPVILKAFDDAANFAEDVSITQGGQGSHSPFTLKVIEQLRLTFTGQGEPKDLV